MEEQASHINLDALNALCKGDKDKKARYLHQFIKMQTPSIKKLKSDLETENRSGVVGEIHFMSPQLQFFGIDDFKDLLRREKESPFLQFNELRSRVLEGIDCIEKAMEEVKAILEDQSNTIDL